MKRVSLYDARDRAGLTQLELEELSGIDRTRISKLEATPGAKCLADTYDALATALRKSKGLRANEVLVMGGNANTSEQASA